MRDFVVAVMAGAPMPERRPPLDFVRINHLGPIAYRMGIQELRGEYAASLIMAERRRNVIREIAAAFAACGIEVALLKGSSLVGVIYPDPAERPMQDVDVLIRTPQLPEAIRQIKVLGFRRVGFSRKLSSFYHAVVFLRGELMVELHRHIVQAYRTSLRIEDVWDRAGPDALGSGALRLEPVDDLLICMLHMARHELAVPILNYLDVWRMWNRLDADERTTLLSRARGYRIERTVAMVLRMTEMLAAGAHGSPGEGRLSTILPTTDDMLRGTHPHRLRQLAQKLLLTEGTRERLGLGFAYGAAILEGWWRSRSEDQR